MKQRFVRSTAIGAGLCAITLVFAGCGGGGGGGSQTAGSVKAFCKTEGNASVNPSDASSKEDFSTAANEAKKIADAAPSEIKDDVQTVADGLEQASEHGTAEWEDSSVQAAWQRVESFIQDKCA